MGIVIPNQDSTSSRLLPGSSYSYGYWPKQY
jgi:hypothetical protein